MQAAGKTDYINVGIEYSNLRHEIDSEVEDMMASEQRFKPIEEREEKGVFDVKTLYKLSKGKYATRWRGVILMKDCLDMVIYQQLMWEVQPQTIFETGAYTGASAMWFVDTMKSYELPVYVHTIDIDISMVDNKFKSNENVSFKQADAKNICQAFPEELLKTCSHPWMITEDCHVDVIGVMEHFHKYMQEGDYFVIEDTSPENPIKTGSGVPDLNIEPHGWGNKKLNLMKQFLKKYSEYYRVDTFYTDYYGYNGTWNWDGYIKRIK